MSDAQWRELSRLGLATNAPDGDWRLNMGAIRQAVADAWKYSRAIEVPWCAEHDAPMLPIPVEAFCRTGIDLHDYGTCRLQEPPKVVRINE